MNIFQPTINKMLISCLLLLYLTPVFAQEEHLITVSANVGAGLPFGSFSRKEFRDQNSGFAKPGVVYKLAATYQPGEMPFNILLDIRFLSFAFDGKALTESMGSPNYGAYFVRDNYRAFAAYTGLILPIQKHDKIHINFKLAPGILRLQPNSLFHMRRDSSIAFENVPKPTTAFSFIVGLEAQFKIGQRFYFSLTPDVLYSSMDVKNHYRNDWPPAEYTYTQRVLSMNIVTGIGCRF